MTQRMQASLRLLQMGTLDLAGYLAERAVENPCLDVLLPGMPAVPDRHRGAGTAPGVGRAVSDFDAVAALAADRPSLYAHVSAQIDIAMPEGARQAIAYAFLDALEPSGWLGESVEAVAARCGCSPEVAEAVLLEMQQFEPAGLFARTLAECLRLQAEDRDLLTWELGVLLDNLPLLAARDLAGLAALCDCAPADIAEIARVIRSFDPKPGQVFAADIAPIFPPELTARRTEAGWEVELNRSSLPAIRVAREGLAGIGRGREARAFGARALSEAQWLADALERRQTTMLRTASAVIRHQQDFLDRGPGHLRPLSLEDIAAELELHSSTVSRATAGRMIDTPRGAIPLRAFFCRAFPQEGGGGDRSQDAVLRLVQRIVAGENAARPLSDTDIARRAGEAGVRLARRTVAKYRDMLGIASSFERRQGGGPPR